MLMIGVERSVIPMNLRTARPTPRALACALGMGMFLLGCNTPTLPLPPPGAPDVYLQGEEALLSGAEASVEPYADVICFNHATDAGRRIAANAHGAYLLWIPAKPGDALELWQRVGGQYSPSISFVIPR